MGPELMSVTSTRTSGASLLLFPSASTQWQCGASRLGTTGWDSEGVRPARFNRSGRDVGAL